MCTNYSPAATSDARAPLPPVSGRYSGAAALCAAIRAAAALAPEIAPTIEHAGRYGVAPAERYPFTRPAMIETGAGVFMAPPDHRRPQCGEARTIEAEGPACRWPQVHEYPEAPGPFLPMPADARCTFHYSTPDGGRGSLQCANVRADLLALADRVHAAREAFDGKTRAAPRPKRPAASAPHVTARAMDQAGDHPGALAIAEARGAVFFGHGGAAKCPILYMGAETIEAAGHRFTIGRGVLGGRFRVLHSACGLSVDSVRAGAPDDRGFTTAAAAIDWLETAAAREDWRAKVAAAAAKVAAFDQAAARAAYLAATAPEFRTAEAAQAAEAPAAAPAPAPIEAEAPAAPDPAAVADCSRRAVRAVVRAAGGRDNSGDPARCIPPWIRRAAEHARTMAARILAGCEPGGFAECEAPRLRAQAAAHLAAAADLDRIAAEREAADDRTARALGGAIRQVSRELAAAMGAPVRPAMPEPAPAAIEAPAAVSAAVAANDAGRPDPGPAAPGGALPADLAEAAADAAGAELAAAVRAAADTLARISATWPHDSGRAATIETGRAGDPAAAPKLAGMLQRAADHGRGLTREFAARAVAELGAALSARAAALQRAGDAIGDRAAAKLAAAGAAGPISRACPPATHSETLPPATHSRRAPEWMEPAAATVYRAHCESARIGRDAGLLPNWGERSTRPETIDAAANYVRARRAAEFHRPDVRELRQKLAATVRAERRAYRLRTLAVRVTMPSALRDTRSNETRAELAAELREESRALLASVGLAPPPATHSEAAPHSLDRLRRIHDRIQSTRATTWTRYGQRWVRIMNRLRTLMHSHPDWAAYKRGSTPPATQSGPAAVAPDPAEVSRLATLRADRPETLREAAADMRRAADHCAALPAGQGIPEGEALALKRAAEFDAAAELAEARRAGPFRVMVDAEKTAGEAPTIEAARELAARLAAAEPFPCTFTIHGPGGEVIEDAATAAGLPMLQPGAVRADAAAAEWAAAEREAGTLAARAAKLASAPTAPECGGSVAFVHPSDPARLALAGPEMSADRGHAWRCTFIDAAGPVSDCGAGSLAAACELALSAGFEPAPPGYALPAPPATHSRPDLTGQALEYFERAAKRCAADPRPRHGLLIEAAALRETGAGMRRNVSEGIADASMRAAWSANAPAADAAAAELEAIAGKLPEPPAPERAHLPFDGYGGTWDELRRSLIGADEYRGHVLAAMREALAAGLFYNAETYPRAAAIMAERWGYPDAREIGGKAEGGVFSEFASHCYMARQALRAEEEREANRAAAAKLHPGQKFGRLIVNGKTYTGAAIVGGIPHTGESIELSAKCAGRSYSIKMHAAALAYAIERTEQRAADRAETRARKAGKPAPARAASLPIAAEAGTPPATQPRTLTPEHLRTFATDEADERAAAPVRVNFDAEPAQDAGPWRFSAGPADEYAPANRPVHVLFCANRRRALGEGGQEAGAGVGFYMARQTYAAIPAAELATPADFERFGVLQPAPAAFLWSAEERAAEALRNGRAQASHAEPEAKPEPAPAVAPAFVPHCGDLAKMANARSGGAHLAAPYLAAGMLRDAADGWLSLTDAGRDALQAAGYVHVGRVGFGWVLPYVLPRLILATIAERESALTPAGLAQYGPIPAELATVDEIERAARRLTLAGVLGMFDYSAQSMPPGFYMPGPAPEYSRDSERVRSITRNVLAALAAVAPGGVPTAAGLASEAARIEASALRLSADGIQTTAGAYLHVAASLRELEETRRADEAAERDASSHYTAPAWPVMVAHAHHAAQRAPLPPLLRIPAGDPRLRIPAQFAPKFAQR